MKLKINRYFFLFAIIAVMGILFSDCSKKKDSGSESAFQASDDSLFKYISVVQKKTLLDKYWQLDYIKEWYKTRNYPPPMDFNVDLKSKGIVDLWLLKNEVFARNGYLFSDAVLRGYFKRYKWYQPVWDIADFKVELTQQEFDFLKKIISMEREKAKQAYVQSGSYRLVNYDHILNRLQFTAIPEQLKNSLMSRNFAIVPAAHEQLFYVYDKNQYEYIPNFITTDLYLQVLHKHLSSLMQNIEKEKFTALLNNLLSELLDKNSSILKTTTDSRIRSAALWSQTYLAVAKSLLTGEKAAVPSEVQDYYNEEISKINEAQGLGSQFLTSILIDYSQFKPRGNYTESEELKRYFRCVRWLNFAPMYTDQDDSFISAVMMAYFIKGSSSASGQYSKFSQTVKFIAGDEDNLSINHLINILDKDYSGKDLYYITKKENLDKIEKQLRSMDPSRINPKAGNKLAKNEFSRQNVLFTAGRYNFDGEIFIRLVNILHPEPKRPFPKALDIFAVMGNKSAEDILLNVYKEGTKWDGYTKELNTLKKQFSNGISWDSNIYNKTMDAVISMQQRKPEYPLFMQTHYWDKKNLITSLAAWTELKHDMILYSEQPFAAEAGGGEDGPPPPVQMSYVEPNTSFWSKAIELIRLEENVLKDNGLLTDKVKEIDKELTSLAELLLRISQKELKHENLNNKDFEELTWIGGNIEQITFRILDNDHLPEREKKIALAADVYTYNNDKLQNNRLEEAVGNADEIYVVAEINGRPYITKGAVFSHYEFTSGNRFTDEEWQKVLGTDQMPKRAVWMDEIIVKTKPLTSRPEYGFSL